MLRLLTTWRRTLSASDSGQTRVQARPVSDIHSAYGVRRCMAWIALTNNMAEIFRQLVFFKASAEERASAMRQLA